METPTLPVKVGGELVINLDDVPPHALARIKAGLTIANEEKDKASSIKQFGWWDMPDTIALYREEARRGGDKVICLPRGCAQGLTAEMHAMGIQVVFNDGRTTSPAGQGYFTPFLLRDYQFEAALAMLQAQQGVYKCPAGGGKTVTSLGAMAHAGQRTLVIVDKVALANQWRVRAHEFFGMPLEEVEKEDGTTEKVAPLKGERIAGLIGKGVWEERDLTICLRQTLYERDWQLDATSWWKSWGMVFFDECHHLSADTLAEVCRKVTAKYMLGVSATPAKSPAKGQMVAALVGPIVHETPRQVLYDRGVLMKPTIEVLKGDFFTPFWPDHESDPQGNCEAEGCRKRGKHRHRNNYSSVLKKLVEDDARNTRIAERVMADRGHVHLIPSGQLKHLNFIRHKLLELGWPEDKIWYLRGEENAKGQDQKIIQDVVASDEAVILATIQVAGEAMDIPPIDRVHVVFPMRDEGATIQLVGRGERVAKPRKTDAYVIDYREPKMDVLEGQFGERDRVYRMAGYPIETSPYSVVEEASVA